MDNSNFWFLMINASIAGSIICGIISRSINNKSIKKLTIEEKGKVVEFDLEQVKARNFKERTLPFVGIITVLFYLSYLDNFPLLLITCIALNFIWFRIITSKRISYLSSIGLPISYKNSYGRFMKFQFGVEAFRTFFLLSIYMYSISIG